ncbi:MAG: 3-methyl-2-oxobutanoate hydroxymethyltransferase [Lentisphaerae bacterium]|nr:3-methyl-2-oxobutanoate hydroxymethyltransferase [Lentisphaerota bacterium]
MKQWTALQIKNSKGRQRLACLTAYDAGMARLLDEAGIPLILVGDSVANTMLGHATTLPVTLEQMLHHTAAVARGVAGALVVGDMPFMSYQAGDDQAVRNAGRFLQEAGADAVKLEGGRLRAGLIRRLVDNGIPVMGHLGLTPQSVLALGGYKVQGRQPEAAAALMADAEALDQAGVFSIVLECVPAALAQEITAAVSVPTIGIGAGSACDGQILVLHDLLGLTPPGATAKFVKRYAELGAAVSQAVHQYQSEVESGAFPAPEQSY